MCTRNFQKSRSYLKSLASSILWTYKFYKLQSHGQLGVQDMCNSADENIALQVDSMYLSVKQCNIADNTLWVCCKVTGLIDEMLTVSFRIREDKGTKKILPEYY